MKNGPQTASTLSGQMSEMGRNGSVAGFTTRALHPSGADMPGRTRHPFVRLSQPAGESVVAGGHSAPRPNAYHGARQPFLLPRGSSCKWTTRSGLEVSQNSCADRKRSLACSLMEGSPLVVLQQFPWLGTEAPLRSGRYCRLKRFALIAQRCRCG